MPKNIKLVPFTYSEPNPGYLSEFSWVGDTPMSPAPSAPNEIDDAVIKVMRSKNIPGAAVVVMKDNVVIHARGYGYANLGTKQLFTPTTPSRCGSISKTATGLMMLRAQALGGLKLDSKLSEYFTTPSGIKKSSSADQKGWDKIRLRDLIDHRSGVSGDYLPTHALAAEYETKTPMSLAQYVYATRKKRTPGGIYGKYEYHNLNFSLASYVIEEATQKEFGEALYWLLGQPLGIPKSEMFLSPTYGANVPASLPNGEARCYQMRSDLLENIFKKGEKASEAYGGLDGNILAGAGHIAFSANAIAKLVVALRTQPKAFIGSDVWDEITKNPDSKSTSTTFYSKGTNYNSLLKTYSHGAMLMHAGGVYNAYSKDIQFVVIGNSNSKLNEPLIDQHLSVAVINGIAKLK